MLKSVLPYWRLDFISDKKTVDVESTSTKLSLVGLEAGAVYSVRLQGVTRSQLAGPFSDPVSGSPVDHSKSHNKPTTTLRATF